MGIVAVSPRLPSTDPRIPVFPNGRRPTWLVAVVALFAVLPYGAGPRVEAPMLALGSDPNRVATVVRYFRDVPSARAELNGPGPVALRGVDDALRAREG
ncbi:hypothetical protein M3667_00815 [Microbacterium sp. P26]|uniref:hypothetical protein n=1 Tax=Microbacterium TaxID=33882 RepID=UPI00203A50C7|nr:hypothetical protein [Microbacterium sp. P26]MCM3500416.1 hypothetical protein [Microbacterium sp. P26]